MCGLGENIKTTLVQMYSKYRQHIAGVSSWLAQVSTLTGNRETADTVQKSQNPTLSYQDLWSLVINTLYFV